MPEKYNPNDLEENCRAVWGPLDTISRLPWLSPSGISSVISIACATTLTVLLAPHEIRFDLPNISSVNFAEKANNGGKEMSWSADDYFGVLRLSESSLPSIGLLAPARTEMSKKVQDLTNPLSPNYFTTISNEYSGAILGKLESRDSVVPLFDYGIPDASRRRALSSLVNQARKVRLADFNGGRPQAGDLARKSKELVTSSQACQALLQDPKAKTKKLENCFVTEALSQIVMVNSKYDYDGRTFKGGDGYDIQIKYHSAAGLFKDGIFRDSEGRDCIFILCSSVCALLRDELASVGIKSYLVNGHLKDYGGRVGTISETNHSVLAVQVDHAEFIPNDVSGAITRYTRDSAIRQASGKYYSQLILPHDSYAMGLFLGRFAGFTTKKKLFGDQQSQFLQLKEDFATWARIDTSPLKSAFNRYTTWELSLR